MAKFFLLIEPSGLKKRDLKPKCAVTNVDWNNLTFEFLAMDEQNLLGTTSNYLRSSQGTTRNFRTFQGLNHVPLNYLQFLHTSSLLCGPFHIKILIRTETE